MLRKVDAALSLNLLVYIISANCKLLLENQ